MKINIYKMITFIVLTQIFSNFIWLGILIQPVCFVPSILIAIAFFAFVISIFLDNWDK